MGFRLRGREGLRLRRREGLKGREGFGRINNQEGERD